MRCHSLSIGIVACGLLAGGTAAQAGNESWVSGTGSDAGTCPRTAPCRTFQFAHDQTSNNGAINVLTSGNFGPLTITKPISIVADGVEAVINTGANNAGITVQAGANAVVSLRGLTIDMRGAGIIGIVFNTGGALHVHDSVIRRATDGIRFQTPNSGTAELYVADSVITDNSSDGIFVVPDGSANANVVIDRVRTENSGDQGMFFFGIGTTGSINATVRDSVSAGNATAGISASRNTAASVNVMVDRSTSINNGIGIEASSGATIRIGDSTVSGNTNGINFGGGSSILSYGTNKINGNGGNEAPTSTIAMK